MLPPPPPLKKDGLTFSKSINKANIIGDRFCSVFIQEDMSDLPALGPGRTSNVPYITVNIRGVLKLLKGINPTKNILGRLLKEAAEELTPALAHLFQISIDSGNTSLD